MLNKFLLTLIIILAATLRFYHLGDNPPSLYWDEVGLGYNAYSILQTARDEHGNYLPHQYFLSFRDYKPPVYIYATVPAIYLFGLTEFAVRFPSALAGTLSVLLVYLLTKELLQHVIPAKAGIHPENQSIDNKKNKTKSVVINSLDSQSIPTIDSCLRSNDNKIALLAAFLFALSPWSIQISRVAYEANIGQFLTTLGIYLFLVAIRQSKNFPKTCLLATSALSFALTFYTFNSNRIFTPLIVTLLAVLYFKKIFSVKFWNFFPAIISTVLGIALILPLVPHLTSKEGKLRYQEVNIFSNPAILELAQSRIDRAGDTWLANIFNNRRIYYFQEWLSGYFSHFRGDFLFIRGDVNPRFSSGDVGLLYLATLPFILIGLYFSATKLGKGGWFLIGWLLLAPAPAAFAREVPHALRTLHILPTYDIFAAIGFVYLLSKMTNLKSQTTHNHQLWFGYSKFDLGYIAKILAIPFSVTFLLVQFAYFTYNYYSYYPKQYSDEWQYGYKQMVQELVKIQNNYDRIVVTNARGRAYANVLFYQAFPPAQFQSTKKYKYDELGLLEVSAFDKYEFHGVDWIQEITKVASDEKVLIIGTPSEVKQGKWTKAIVPGLDKGYEFILNEVPQGVENATEQYVYRNLDLYNKYHNTNYLIDKENNWVIN